MSCVPTTLAEVVSPAPSAAVAEEAFVNPDAAWEDAQKLPAATFEGTGGGGNSRTNLLYFIASWSQGWAGIPTFLYPPGPWGGAPTPFLFPGAATAKKKGQRGAKGNQCVARLFPQDNWTQTFGVLLAHFQLENSFFSRSGGQKIVSGQIFFGFFQLF